MMNSENLAGWVHLKISRHLQIFVLRGLARVEESTFFCIVLHAQWYCFASNRRRRKSFFCLLERLVVGGCKLRKNCSRVKVTLVLCKLLNH